MWIVIAIIIWFIETPFLDKHYPYNRKIDTKGLEDFLEFKFYNP